MAKQDPVQGKDFTIDRHKQVTEHYDKEPPFHLSRIPFIFGAITAANIRKVDGSPAYRVTINNLNN